MGKQNLASLGLATAEPPSGQKASLEGEHLASPAHQKQKCLPSRDADKAEAHVTWPFYWPDTC